MLNSQKIKHMTEKYKIVPPSKPNQTKPDHKNPEPLQRNKIITKQTKTKEAKQKFSKQTTMDFEELELAFKSDS